MLGLGAFAFAAPGMLALLLALPVIYWSASSPPSRRR